MRFEEPGFQEICIPDPSGRRGLWMKRDPALPAGAFMETDGEPPTSIELCAGREGDDADVLFEVGQTVTQKQILQLHDLLLTVRYACAFGDDQSMSQSQRVALVIHNARSELLECLRSLESVRTGETQALNRSFGSNMASACDAGFASGRAQTLRELLPLLKIAYDQSYAARPINELHKAWLEIAPTVRNEVVTFMCDERERRLAGVREEEFARVAADIPDSVVPKAPTADPRDKLAIAIKDGKMLWNGYRPGGVERSYMGSASEARAWLLLEDRIYRIIRDAIAHGHDHAFLYERSGVGLAQPINEIDGLQARYVEGAGHADTIAGWAKIMITWERQPL